MGGAAVRRRAMPSIRVGNDLAVVNSLLETVANNFSLQNGTFSDIVSVEFNSTVIAILPSASHGQAGVAQVATTMYIYFTPCLVTLGIAGNALSVYVFFTSKLRLQSTGQYLSALAVSDSLFLAQLLPPWLSTIEINGLFHQTVFCKAFVYVSYVTCCYSAWLVIAFTVERYVAVKYPLQRIAVCTVTRARYVIFGLVIMSMLINAPVLHFAGSGGDECNIDREKLVHAARFNWLDTVISFTIPLALIVALNMWIMVTVWRLARTRQRLVKRERAESPTPGTGSQHHVTRMLLIVSSVFVILNLPAYALRVMAYAYDTANIIWPQRSPPYMYPYSQKSGWDSDELDERWMVVQHVAAIMFNANFGINFFLYCLSGQNFRRALLQSVPCFGWLLRRGGAAGSTTTHHGRANSLTTSAMSNSTEPAGSCGLPALTPRPRRRPADPYILRWTFDNSRQRRGSAMHENIEMRDLSQRTTRVPRAPCTPTVAYASPAPQIRVRVLVARTGFLARISNWLRLMLRRLTRNAPTREELASQFG